MSNEWIFPLSDVKISDIVIGRGAFGEVRVGTWRNIQVACKKLHSISSSGSSTIDGNSIGNSVGDDALIDENILKREIEVLSKLRHPNLLLFIGVCGSLTSCNDTIILTELMPCSLYDLIETQKVKLDLADILDLSIDIANGLHYLHSHEPPILHRDISSKNILLGSNGAKIADLGQAKLFGQSTISRQTGMPGAMAYSAPEVLTGKYSEKIDVFSYGILLIQMCINEYPRIDKREEQCLLACNQHNILQQLIENCISYQPSLRLQSFEICQQLLDIKSNDRYYPLIRKISPEKDISVLARSYMNIQINKHNSDIKLLLQQTNCRLVAEENRYKLEANKVDELTKSISGLHLINTNNNMLINQLTIENELYKKEIDNNNITINTLTNSNRSLLNDKNRLSELCNNYELQLAQKSLDINKLTTSLTEYRNLCNNSDNMLITIQQSEANLIKKNNELKLQLNMQVEYNSDLESRLEQTLTRWKHERDTLIKETERCNKLRNNCSNIIEKNNKLEADLFRYEERLKLYDDLPLPDEIKMRMNDLQNDYQRVASECCSLLTQKETLVEKNLEHESQIRFLESKMKNFEDDLKAKNETIEANKKLIDELNKKNDITDSKFKDMLDDNILLKDEIEIGKKREQALKDEISELKIELERQRRVIKNIRHSSVLGSPMNRTISNSPSYEEAGFESYEGSNYNSNNNSFMISNNVDSAILPPLLEEVPNSNNMNIMDNNGDDIGDRVPEGTIKVNLQHKINSDGAAGALSMLLSSQNDDRVVWRCARALRELVIQDDNARQFCITEKVDEIMLNCVVVFVSNATVQAQCIRLIGALAFGNDYVRRRMGEQGIMKSLVAALENHKDDETVQLHICTAITNLTHNSFENRSRFMELNGFEYILNSMDRFKLSSKYQRQACWAILTLSGSDDISKTIANAGADTAIINAMLQHRFDVGVQQFGCWALSNMALSGEEIARKLKKKGVVEVCRIALETHPNELEVVRQARNALGALSPNLPTTGVTIDRTTGLDTRVRSTAGMEIARSNKGSKLSSLHTQSDSSLQK